MQRFFHGKHLGKKILFHKHICLKVREQAVFDHLLAYNIWNCIWFKLAYIQIE